MTNNVLHAKLLLDLLEEYPPEEYFCVSTDKAANPVNIMGASKRIMEDLIFSYSDKFPVKTARFANVAFSNGSLPAGFLDRIQKQQLYLRQWMLRDILFRRQKAVRYVCWHVYWEKTVKFFSLN